MTDTDWKARAEAAEARVKELERLRLEVERAECLRDSAYKAGLKAGWNLAVSNDEAGYQAAMESTEHIAELKRIREAIRALSEQSRLRGEAEGKLAALEIAGVVDDWKARAEAAEARVKELEGALEWYMEQVKTMSQFGAALTAALENRDD